MNNGRWKVKIPLILTILDAMVCHLPILMILLIGGMEDLPEFIAGLTGIAFLIVFIFFVIGVLVVPCEQFALIIWAIATKKRWLMAIHIPFTVLSIVECIVVVNFLHFASMQ